MNHTDPLLNTMKQRRRRLLNRQGYRSLFLRLLFFVFAAWLLFTQVFLLMRVKGNDMFPAVKDGDVVFAFRLQQKYIKDDIVVYEMDGEQRVGRLAADAGDRVAMDDSGTLLVNGAVQTGEILYPTYAREGEEGEFFVPENHVYLLGDHRTQAQDSRDHGPIPKEEIKGKIITLLRRRGL